MTFSTSWAPLEIEAKGEGGTGELLSRLEELELGLSGTLVKEKALVFRGFGITPETLDTALDRLLPNRLAYVHGNSPRTKVGGNVYTSTEYPQEFTISMHNEMSYAHAWPSRLAFFCQIQPGSGGATPVLDAERWLAVLDPEVRDAFAAWGALRPEPARRLRPRKELAGHLRDLRAGGRGGLPEGGRRRVGLAA